MTRRYRQQQRALSREETRARIVEAAIALHQNPGPKATTISAIAERAGVQRLTVYRHFPDETDLFQACSSRWGELNPPPDPASWAKIADPETRVVAALTALYRFYRDKRGMLASVIRDEPEVPSVTVALSQMRAFIDTIAVDLAKGLKADARGLASLRHAVQFPTWVSLSELCGSDAKAARLAAGWLQGGRGRTHS